MYMYMCMRANICTYWATMILATIVLLWYMSHVLSTCIMYIHVDDYMYMCKYTCKYVHVHVYSTEQMQLNMHTRVNHMLLMSARKHINANCMLTTRVHLWTCFYSTFMHMYVCERVLRLGKGSKVQTFVHLECIWR